MKSKIFIINLDQAKERKVDIEKQFIEYNIDNYEFIKAINGNELDINPVPLPSKFDRKHLGENYRKHFNNNEIACIHSHIKAIKKAKEEELDYVIILEDDIIIAEDWNNRLEKLMKITPKSWEHIYLSGLPNEIEQSKTFRPLNLAPFLHIEKSINTMGAFSYIVKNTIYDKLISELNKFILPVDDVISDMIVNNKIKSFTFYPFLSYHDNEKTSTIWNDINNQSYEKDHESKRFYVNKL